MKTAGRHHAAARALLTALVLFACQWAAAAPAVEESDLKAAFLYNFAKLIEWPAGSVGPHGISLCVLNGQALDPALSALDGRPVEAMKLNVRHIATLAECDGCQLLFVGPDRREPTGAITARVRGKPVATVAERAGFAGDGGVIEIYREGAHLRFAINVAAAREQGLVISSRLLRLARIVDQR